MPCIHPALLPEIISAEKDFFPAGNLDLMRRQSQPIMSSPILFQINRPQVICQTIEGEAVVINLQTGAYYSLTGAAAAIWSAVEQGEPAVQIQSSLAARFTDCDAGLANIVADFLEELRGESLIVPAENGRHPGEVAKTNGVLIVRGKIHPVPRLKNSPTCRSCCCSTRSMKWTPPAGRWPNPIRAAMPANDFQSGALPARNLAKRRVRFRRQIICRRPRYFHASPPPSRGA